MYSILKNGNNTTLGVKEYLVKTVDDITSIELNSNVASGSQVLVTSTGERFILDLDRKWTKITQLPM